MEKEDFIAWKESHATQEVMKRLRQIGQGELEELGETARSLLSADPGTWAAAQPGMAEKHGAAYQKGAFIELEFDDLFEEKETKTE